MFNGGTRKRPFPSSSSSSSLNSSQSASSASLPSPGSHHQSHHPSHSHSHLSPPSTMTASSRTSLSSSELSGAGQGLAGMYGGRSSHLHFEGGGGASSTKKSKQASVSGLDSNPYMQKHTGAPFVNPFSPYWLAAASSGPGKAPYPFMAMNASQPMCFGFPSASHPGPSQHPSSKDMMSDRMKNAHLSPASWIGRASAAAAAAAGGAPPFPLPSMDFFWDKAFAFPQAAALGFRPGTYPSALMPPAVSGGGNGGSNVNGGAINNMGGPGASLMELPEHFSPEGQINNTSSERSSSYNRMGYRELEKGEKVKDHMSAFKRVRPSSSSPSSSGSPPPNSTFEDHEEVARYCPEDITSQEDQQNDSNNNHSSRGNNNNSNPSFHDNKDEASERNVDGDVDEDGDGSMCAEDLSTQRELEESEDIDVEEEEGVGTDGVSADRCEPEKEKELNTSSLSHTRNTTEAVKEIHTEEGEKSQRFETQEVAQEDRPDPEVIS